MPYLVPGIYDLHAEVAGFKTVERKGVEVQVGAVARIDFKLELGELNQKIEVTGGAPLAGHRFGRSRQRDREPADRGPALERARLPLAGGR